MVPRQNQISDQMRSLIFKLVYEDFKAQREVARTLNIPKSTVSSILKKFEETGQVSASTRGGARNTIITQQINDRIIELMNKDRTTNHREIQQQLGVDLKDLGFTYELVRPIYEKRNTPKTKNHGWLRRGRTPNPIVRPRSSSITMILAMNWHNIVNSEAIRGSINTEVFNDLLTATMNVLGQAEEFIFVLDNVNFHHVATIPDNSNFSMHYLPPYSPTLNPCEEAFALI
ncbi:hypothetical protein RF11_04179 [Thelohanellus kitauei]|uniref:Tc1-like transposase DDE domain-containing protein n=1 Tax=Thelohanellus kitauei TaxID=669202 RepID=A0A0C2MJD6_THEKT|nr:hypothetical protein RF11_04179 [Thelohanellus kitauei]